MSSPKHQVEELTKSMYETKMTLRVRQFDRNDVGSYRCIAKNSLGEVDSNIRLYGELRVGFVVVEIISLIPPFRVLV